MSVPLPIHVALIGSSRERVSSLRKHFRLCDVGSIYYSAIDAIPGERVVPLFTLPRGLITLWLCLDPDAHSASVEFHARDRQLRHYSRICYDEHFPEPCVLLDGGKSVREMRSLLSGWMVRIREAHAATS